MAGKAEPQESDLRGLDARCRFNSRPQGLCTLSCFSSSVCSGPCTLERCLCAETVAVKRSGAAESRVATVEMVRGGGHEHSWGGGD